MQCEPAGTIPATAILRRRFDEAGWLLLQGQEASSERLTAVARHFCTHFYISASRQSVADSTGEILGECRLLGHAEGFYRPCPSLPDVGLLMCVVPPAGAGGETFLIDGREMLRRIPAPLTERLQSEPIVYESLWPPARWQAEFGVRDADGLHRMLAAYPDCSYTLNEDGLLHIFYRTFAVVPDRHGAPAFLNGALGHLPAIRHPRYTGVETWSVASNRIHWGYGGQWEDDVVNALIDAHDACLRKHRWQAGDLLIFDNHRFLHGREATLPGSGRRLLSCFGYLQDPAAAPLPGAVGMTMACGRDLKF